MKRYFPRALVLILSFCLVPAALALSQDVPTQSAWQSAVLLLSVSGFGLLLAQFWLSRRLPRDAAGVTRSASIGYHRLAGYAVGGFILAHPLLMVARRTWVQDSDAGHNLVLMLTSPAMWPAIAAWALLLVLVITSIRRARRLLRGRLWLRVHGLLACGLVGLATWHVVAIGRHSDPTMSALWITLAVAATLPILRAQLPTQGFVQK